MYKKSLICLFYFLLFSTFGESYLLNHKLDSDSIKKIQQIKKEERALKKQKKAAIHDHSKFIYTAQQKNKLNIFVERDGLIWFANKKNKYTYFLSNDYPIKIKIWGKKFRNAEAAFQAAKFLHQPKLAEKFSKLSGSEAIELSLKHSYEQRPEWHHYKENTMLEVLRAKFTQHPRMKELLLATGDAYLLNRDKNESYWGDGKEGRGKNRLGYLLMQLRKEFGGIGLVSKPKRHNK